MSKVIEFELDSSSLDSFTRIIRRKKDIVLLLIDIVRFISIHQEIPIVDQPVGKLKIVIDKMSRIFIISDYKHVTFSFPFTLVQDENEGFYIRSPHYGVIDSVVLSKIKRLLLDDSTFEDACISSFADNVLDNLSVSPSFWSLLRELLLFEDGYLRFDHDPDPERLHATKHPLNHLDIFYSGYASFKLGVDKHLDEYDLPNILDLNSDCSWLSHPK